MSLSAKVRRAPLRVVTGAYILNSGLGKLKADEDMAKGLHGMASGTYGVLDKVDHKVFAKGLAAAEITLGGALLLPIVPPVVAGLGLCAFAGGLLNMYWHTPGMHEPNDPRPTQQGIAISKDLWMFGIGAGLVADAVLEPAHDKKVELASAAHERSSGRAKRKARKAARKARAEAAAQLLDTARQRREDVNKKAVKAAAKARKSQAAAAGKHAVRETAASAQALGKDASKKAKDVSQKAKDVSKDVTERAKSVVS